MIEYMAILMASAIWSLNPALVSRFREYIKPITYNAVRAIIAVIFILPLAFFNRLKLPETPLLFIAIAVLTAILGPGIGDAAYTKAIQLIGGSLAVILSYTYMFVAQGIAIILLGEELTVSLFIGAVIAFVGVVIATAENPRGRFKWGGVVYALITSISWGIGASILKIILSFADILTVTIIRLAAIAILFLPIGIIVEGRPPENSLKLLIPISIVTGGIGWGVGMYLFIYSISSIGVAATTLATALTPILSQITTKLFARERLSKNNIIGALMIFIGIAFSSM